MSSTSTPDQSFDTRKEALKFASDMRAMGFKTRITKRRTLGDIYYYGVFVIEPKKRHNRGRYRRI